MRYAYGNTYSKTHGLSKTGIYKIFSNMKSRCYNKNSTRYERYGGRGINICNEWLNDFVLFYNWSLENGYKEGLSIERIDIDKGYNPDNCKWINKAKQSLNTRRTHNITHNGTTKCLEHWCKDLGKHSNTIHHRVVNMGMTYEEALFGNFTIEKNKKEFCVNGHEYTDENTLINGKGYKYCKICQLERRKKINEKRRKERSDKRQTKIL